MRVDLVEFIKVYGPWTGLAVVLILTFRAQIGAMIERRARLGETDREQELRFDEQARAVLLESQARNWQYLDKVLQQYDDERRERRLLGERLIEQALSTERMVRQALDTMQGFAEVGRLQCERLDAQGERQSAMMERTTMAIEALTRTSTATWFVLARYGLKGPEDLDEMVSVMEEGRSDRSTAD